MAGIGFDLSFERAAREAGKDPARMAILAELMVVVGGERAAEEAASYWRFRPHAWEHYVEVPDPRTIADEAAEMVPLAEVARTMVVGTDPERHVRKLEERFSQGVTQVFIHSGQPDQRRVIDFYGREVLPRIRKSLSKAA